MKYQMTLNITKRFAAVLTIFVVCSFSLFSCSNQRQTIKNVILMIGDGMGFNHLLIADSYREDQGLFMVQQAKFSAQIRTSSLNSSVTDSAAAASAYATGYKMDNGEVSYHNGVAYETISELILPHQKGVGIIASEALYGATPASFSAHSSSRSNINEITQQQMSSEIDLFLGANQSYYDGIENIMSNYQRHYTSNYADLNNLLLVGKTSSEKQKYWAAFSSIALNSSQRSNVTPTLSDLSTSALDYLDDRYSQKGFFLMIEGSHIDKKSHANDLQGTMEEVFAFDETVETVVNWAKHDQETLVMVVADHETGGLSYTKEGNAVDAWFTTTGHTACHVPFLLFQDTPASFQIEASSLLDNTQIYFMLRQLLLNEIR